MRANMVDIVRIITFCLITCLIRSGSSRFYCYNNIVPIINNICNQMIAHLGMNIRLRESEYGGYRAKNFAVLMFAEKPDKFIPYAHVEITIIKSGFFIHCLNCNRRHRTVMVHKRYSVIININTDIIRWFILFEIAEILNVKAEAVRYRIKLMKKSGEITRKGATKAGEWEVIE